MEGKSKESTLIAWLNTLIVMAQRHKHLPLYFGRLFQKPDQYRKALDLIRKTPAKGPLPEAAGNALSKDEWQRLYQHTTSAAPLRKLFADHNDPFHGASAQEISSLAELSDITTDPQTLFYSRNGTFHLVLEAVRQRTELDAKKLIIDCLYKFYTLLDTNKDTAESLYKLAGSDDWHVVLASLYDARDYTSDESEKTTATLTKWNEELTADLRSILLKPMKLYRAPRKLVKLAWQKQKQGLFTEALAKIPENTRLTGSELRQQVSNVAYQLLVEQAKKQLEEIEAELQLLALVARHYIGVRKFAKLDGLVYSWPRIAGLAMANYANLEYVEDHLIVKKTRPPEPELEARDARELYEQCWNDRTVIQFLRLRPYFSEINEDELRRYRPLTPVKISDSAQPSAAPPIVPSPGATQAAVSVAPASKVCELVIENIGPPGEGGLTSRDFHISLRVSNKEVATATVSFSVGNLLQDMLITIGASSDESLQPILQSLFSGTNAEQVLIRAGSQLYEAIISPELQEPFEKAFEGEGPLRLVVASESEEIQYLPWEWLPRANYTELLLSNPRLSLVRSVPVRPDTSKASLSPPIRIFGVFPNSPIGSREVSETSAKAVEVVARAGGSYKAVMGSRATRSKVQNELQSFHPQVVHLEAYVQFNHKKSDALFFLFSSATGPDPPESLGIGAFEGVLQASHVLLVVVGRNDSNRVYGNPGPIVGRRLAGIPAVLVPVHAVDEGTAVTFVTEFYRSFLAGNSLEQALYTARRKVASRGGDWTAFALFANPSALDFLQPLPPTP